MSDLPADLQQQVAKASRRRTAADAKMNKTEAAYASRLEVLRRNHSVLAYWFEAIKLRLADKTWYTPDFMVLRPDLSIEMHEVKGFWRDDARVKIKVAAEQYPFRFIAAQAAKGDGWRFETFGPKEQG